MHTKIDPKRIRNDLGTQARIQTDKSVVEEYASAMLRGDRFPPITVFRDHDTDLLILVDGFHRWEAHMKIKPNEEIDADLQDGTLSDARWMSFTVNATHGLRRSTADKRRIIAEALRHEKGVKMSDRQIGEHVGVDKNTVASVRRELETTGEIHRLDYREGKNGKKYHLKNISLPECQEEDCDKAYIVLPRFPDDEPEVLAEILAGFFDKKYISRLITELTKPFHKKE